MLERLNGEIRRRERVIRIFPNEDSALRLIGAFLAEQHEEWSTGKRYFDMTQYYEWKEAGERRLGASATEDRIERATLAEGAFTAHMGLDLVRP